MTVETLDSSALNELTAALAKLPPLGPWVADAACARLGPHGAEVFTTTEGVLDGNELDAATRVCRHCPVRLECAGYAASTTVWPVGRRLDMGTRAAGRWCGETLPDAPMTSLVAAADLAARRVSACAAPVAEPADHGCAHCLSSTCR